MFEAAFKSRCRQPGQGSWAVLLHHRIPPAIIGGGCEIHFNADRSNYDIRLHPNAAEVIVFGEMNAPDAGRKLKARGKGDGDFKAAGEPKRLYPTHGGKPRPVANPKGSLGDSHTATCTKFKKRTQDP